MLWSLDLKFKLRRTEAPRTVVRAQEAWKYGSESLEGNIENVDMINEYLTTPHTVVRWTVKLQMNEKWIEQLKAPKKLQGTSGGKGNDKDKEDRHTGTSSKISCNFKRASMMKTNTLRRVQEMVRKLEKNVKKKRE